MRAAATNFDCSPGPDTSFPTLVESIWMKLLHLTKEAKASFARPTVRKLSLSFSFSVSFWKMQSWL